MKQIVLSTVRSLRHPRRWAGAAYLAVALGVTVAGYLYGLLVVPVAVVPDDEQRQRKASGPGCDIGGTA